MLDCIIYAYLVVVLVVVVVAWPPLRVDEQGLLFDDLWHQQSSVSVRRQPGPR